MTQRSFTLFAAGAALAAVVGPAAVLANQPLYQGVASSYTELLDCEQKPKAFDPYTLLVPLPDYDPIPGAERSIRCVTRASDDGAGQKGVKVTFEGDFVDLNGNRVGQVPRSTRRTDRNGYAVHDLDLPPLPSVDLIALMEAAISGGKNKAFNSLDSNCQYRERLPCEAGPETLCLLDDERFQVEVDWRSSNDSGQGMLLRSDSQEGLFYFINPASPDLLVQMLNGCGRNDHFWVFYAATTSVEFTVTVTDTQTGVSRTYGDDLGQPAPAVTDTSAFATCP